MMRAPHAIAVAVRKNDGSILVEANPYSPFFQRYRIFKAPLIRGIFVLIDSLVVGMKALNWSAEQLEEDEITDIQASGDSAVPLHDQDQPGLLDRLSRTGAILGAILFGLALFVAIPHLLTAGLGSIFGTAWTVETPIFHLVDGVIKMGIFLSYLALIRRIPDILRVFAYHGAEHKTIYAWEQGLDPTIDNVRVQSRFHPRCGTSFLIFVVVLSILVFSAAFPLLPAVSIENSMLRNSLQVLVKIPLTLPVAAISYEVIRLSSRFYRFTPFRWLASPGLLLQHLTTEEPDDKQLEVAIAALEKAVGTWGQPSGQSLGLEGEAFITGSAAL